MYEELFFRNQGALTQAEQKKLRETPIAIIGLGGTGGFVLENLTRLGAERLILFDGDRFELGNMNRQLLCSIPVLDQPKAQVAQHRAQLINPQVRVEAYAHFNEETAGQLEKARLVVDCTDRVKAHAAISEACNELGVPHVFAACNYSRGMVSVLVGTDFKKMFQVKESADHACTSILAPAATLAGGLAAAQTLAYISGKPHVQAPDVLMFDIFGEPLFWKKRLE